MISLIDGAFLLIGFIVAFVLISQIIIPKISNTPIFPILRGKIKQTKEI